MNDYRYQLEKYRGRGSRYVCPQCGRKYTFTRYIDTHNNNEYVNERVGKCNRLDKCGYHYTPRQYFEDNPWLKDSCLFIQNNRVFKQTNKPQLPPRPEPYGLIPRWVMERTLAHDCNYKRWLRSTFGNDTAERLIHDYYIGGSSEGDLEAAIFWQVDIDGHVRTGKAMNYNPITGKRIKGEGAYVDWIHSIMQREGALPEGWTLRQCLYGEHLLRRRTQEIVAVAEGAKTAHIGSALMPQMVWVGVDAMLSISEERLQPLRGRRCIFFPDEGRGYEEWSKRLIGLSKRVGFAYCISEFIERHAHGTGSDIGELLPTARQ